MVQSENPRSVDRLVRMLVSNGYKTIIIYGGDSALNDAVNYLMLLEPEERDKITLGVIPNGVLNDFAHFWGFDESHVEQTIMWLKQKRVRQWILAVFAMRIRRMSVVVDISSTV